MTNQKLIQDGYKPIDLVVLHDAGIVIQPTSSSDIEPWWKEFPSEGKTFTVDGQALADIAKIMRVETRPLKCTGKNGRISCQGLVSMSIPLVSVELKEAQNSDYPIKNLLGKVENGVLHLIAFFEEEDPCYSSHGGNFDISWGGSIDESLS